MITTDGKNIIAKYLLNQAPEFASHIAVGVGGNALSASVSQSASVSPQFSINSKSLDFEAFRVPVLSRGLVKEDGVEKIIFKAELPTDQRFNITEIGLYPAEYNVIAERFASKTILDFTNSESWTHSEVNSSLTSASVVPYLNYVLDSYESISSPGDIVRPETVGFINSNSSIFDYLDRKNRGEQPRYLDKALMVSGSAAAISNIFDVADGSSYIEASLNTLNLSRNLPTDQIKLAFSLINKSASAVTMPTGAVRIIIELINDAPTSPKAYSNISLPAGYFYDSLSNKQYRYKVITKNISDFTTTASFSWSDISRIRIYAAVEDNGVTNPEEYYFVFDGLRLENISTINPLYSLIAAEYLETENGYPVLKEENSTSYIEYRFGLEVV